MGRSRSRNRTRTFSSNHRLRSVSNTSAYSPKAVPYGISPVGRIISPRPNLTNSIIPIRGVPLIYGNTTRPNTPSQLPRSQPSRIRVYNAPLPTVRSKTPSRNALTPPTTEDAKALVCVRRHQRREVLHATKKTGKGGQASPVFTATSKIICRRKK